MFPWLSMPKGRMGPPLRSFAADAYDCIMVRVLGPTEYTDPRPKAGSPLIVIPIAPSVPSCSKLSRYGLASSEHAARLTRRPTLTAPARDDVSEPRVGTKKRALRSNKETDERQKIGRTANSLTKKAPYKETALGERMVARQALWRFEGRGRGVGLELSRLSELADGEAAPEGAADRVERREPSDDFRRQAYI